MRAWSQFQEYVFLKMCLSFVTWTISGHLLKLILVSTKCFDMKGIEQLSSLCILKLVFHSKLGNCPSVKESFSLGMVDACWDFGVDTSLTTLAFTRISIPVLESNVLHCVCKCVFPNHSDSFCKNARLSFCLFRFLPVESEGKFPVLSKGNSLPLKLSQVLFRMRWLEINSIHKLVYCLVGSPR